MTTLLWDQTGERLFETGVDHCVLYPRTGAGVAWNGITSIQEASSETSTPYYLDGVKYLDAIVESDFKAVVSAFSAPDEFGPCDGNVTLAPGLVAGKQPRARFGFSYRSLLGDDVDNTERGYKLHLVYNVLASPSARNNQTINQSPSPTDLSWEFNSVPPYVTGYKPTAHFVVDSTNTDPTKLQALEDLLYGTVSTDASLPDQDAVIAALS